MLLAVCPFLSHCFHALWHGHVFLGIIRHTVLTDLNHMSWRQPFENQTASAAITKRGILYLRGLGG